MKTKFKNIKGMLRREEMKQIVGGAAYSTGGGGTMKYVGGSLTPDGLATLGMTINYGQNGNTNYSNSFNYGAGANGSSSSGNPTNGKGGDSTTGANTFINSGYANP